VKPWMALGFIVLSGCGGTIAETTTLPPKPHAPSPSAQVIGVEPSPLRTEGETPVRVQAAM
jgi:hypothetical protein